MSDDAASHGYEPTPLLDPISSGRFYRDIQGSWWPESEADRVKMMVLARVAADGLVVVKEYGWGPWQDVLELNGVPPASPCRVRTYTVAAAKPREST